VVFLYLSEVGKKNEYASNYDGTPEERFHVFLRDHRFGHLIKLTGNLKGCFSLDLRKGYRLLFKPAGNVSEKRKPDGGINWTLVTAVKIIDVEDYHGD